MGRTPSQHAETARKRTTIGTFRTAIGAVASLLFCVAPLFCVANSQAGDDTPPKSEKSDAGSANQKASGTSKESSKGEKSWSTESSTPKPTVHRPRPNVNLKDSAAVAAAVDKMILQNLTESGTQPAPRTSDEDF